MCVARIAIERHSIAASLYHVPALVAFRRKQQIGPNERCRLGRLVVQAAAAAAAAASKEMPHKHIGDGLISHRAFNGRAISSASKLLLLLLLLLLRRVSNASCAAVWQPIRSRSHNTHKRLTDQNGC